MNLEGLSTGICLAAKDVASLLIHHEFYIKQKISGRKWVSHRDSCCLYAFICLDLSLEFFVGKKLGHGKCLSWRKRSQSCHLHSLCLGYRMGQTVLDWLFLNNINYFKVRWKLLQVITTFGAMIACKTTLCGTFSSLLFSKLETCSEFVQNHSKTLEIKRKKLLYALNVVLFSI